MGDRNERFHASDSVPAMRREVATEAFGRPKNSATRELATSLHILTLVDSVAPVKLKSFSTVSKIILLQFCW